MHLAPLHKESVKRKRQFRFAQQEVLFSPVEFMCLQAFGSIPRRSQINANVRKDKLYSATSPYDFPHAFPFLQYPSPSLPVLKVSLHSHSRTCESGISSSIWGWWSEMNPKASSPNVIALPRFAHAEDWDEGEACVCACACGGAIVFVGWL